MVEQAICNRNLQEMIEERDLTPDQRVELERFISDNGNNCSDFMRFLRVAQTKNPFDSFNGVSVPQLFESYKQWAQLLSDVGNLTTAVRTKLTDLRRTFEGKGEEEYYGYLMDAIHQKVTTVHGDAYHESRLNIDELSELMTALKVILTLSELNETHAFSCLYLLNHTGFDEYVKISNNDILEDILSDAGRKIDQVVPDPDIITDLNENDEHRMDELGRIVILLKELNSQGVGLNIVDARIPVIHPNVARKCLEGDEEECAISMDKLKSLPLSQKVMLTCGHAFKKDYIKRWLKDHVSCPSCRAPAQLIPAYKGSTYRPTHVPPGKIAKALVARKQDKGKALVEPVVLHCGHVVEKSVMDSRFERNIKTCPKCGVSATEYIIPSGGSRKHKRNGRGKSKKLIKRKKTIKRRKNNTSR